MNLHRFHVKTIKTTSKLQKRSNYNELHRFDVMTHRKCWVTSQCIKTTKNYKSIKLQWIASICLKSIKTTQKYKSDHITMNCIDFMSNDQNNAKLQKRSNYNELHRFDVITIKNVELRRNAFKTTQNYKSNQITMTCIYLMSKHWKQPKTKIVIILRWICIYLMSNQSKMLSYVSMHSKQHKTTKVIKLQWLASIWCQKHQNNEKLQTRSNYDDLHRFDVKTI